MLTPAFRSFPNCPLLRANAAYLAVIAAVVLRTAADAPTPNIFAHEHGFTSQWPNSSYISCPIRLDDASTLFLTLESFIPSASSPMQALLVAFTTLSMTTSSVPTHSKVLSSTYKVTIADGTRSLTKSKTPTISALNSRVACDEPAAMPLVGLIIELNTPPTPITRLIL